jgi:hypothetical protein
MRKLLLLLLLCGPFMLVSCDDNGNGNPADTTAPDVTILTPLNGASVQAADVQIRARATDNKGIAKVEFFVDEAKIGEDATGLANVYEFTWAATGLAAGSSHTIRAHAIDTSNNDDQATIAVTIAVGAGTIHSENITADETWTPLGNPHIVTGPIGVGNGDGGSATLTILPGCIVQFEPNADAGIGVGWVAQGAIVAVGTPALPILFTSRSATPDRGDWRGLTFFEGTMATTRFSYCTIEYTGFDNGAGIFVTWGAAVKMDHCTIRHGGGKGISYDHGGYVDEFNNNTVTACADYPLETEPEFVRHLGTGNSFTGNDAGKDKIMVYDGVMVTSGTWNNQGVPYEISVINAGGGIWVTPTDGTTAVLTIQAGTTIRFGAGSQLMVGFGGSLGGLIAVGTAQHPITFTSAAANPQPGDWHQIDLEDGAVDGQCRLEHCVIEYGGGAEYGNLEIVDSYPTVTNCIIRNGASYGIFLGGNEHPEAGTLEADNTFSGNAGANVYLQP